MSDDLDKLQNNVMDKLQNNALLQNKGTTFIKAALAYVDGGNFFRTPLRCIYALIGLAIALYPFYQLYTACKLFQYMKAWSIVVFFITWIVLVAGGIVSFLIWWYRKDEIPEPGSESDGFPVTPVFAHFIRVFGEWAGFYVGVVGCLVLLLGTVLRGGNSATGFATLGTGFQAIITAPILGFIIILITRFISEQARALAAIATNTKK